MTKAALQMLMDAADAMTIVELQDALIVLINERLTGEQMEVFANEIGRAGHMKARYPQEPKGEALPFIRRKK